MVILETFELWVDVFFVADFIAEDYVFKYRYMLLLLYLSVEILGTATSVIKLIMF